jgi:transcriptional regulator with XRE-family HTH domain
MNRSNFRRARKTIDVSVGESVRIIRELQELSQNGLAELTGIPQSTISAIENDRVKLSVERAKLSSSCRLAFSLLGCRYRIGGMRAV